ncbi:quinol-cytochrome oxidoreductase complex cytochrome b subunit [Thermocatellispora tengchongensis]|uniref:Cytochrome bc1 complex cytochrome b subunit n=1 Tax=Thermocatellispora tengchongensis TaxID=1073253 RepID=A0A840P8V7_9ACTN|nr:cytochrome b N-terminal domain-containing protein [Thermocatellispora tengchongensis]MBB5132425.1 quinol-cytochrome oxidoreductase complex cytochrome b subunit [Thermocatellispora tengchongensis]
MTELNTVPSRIAHASSHLDARLGGASFLRRNMRKIFPDHWSFLLGEIALYSFVILLLTGTFLTFWFKPSMGHVLYDGPYEPLRGVMMSEAYASALEITFEVRGGLLVRQIHHWAALVLMWRQKHTQMPGKGRTNRNVVGAPFYPSFMAKSGAYFLFTLGVIAGLATFAQINPIWLYGPYTPADVSAGSQPDFYLAFLEGALRIMPAWEINLFGTAEAGTLPMSVIIPGLVPLGVILVGLSLYPFAER